MALVFKKLSTYPQRLLLLLILLYSNNVCNAQPTFDPTNPPLNISSSDSVVSLYPWQLQVPSGSLTANPDGSAQLTFPSIPSPNYYGQFVPYMGATGAVFLGGWDISGASATMATMNTTDLTVTATANVVELKFPVNGVGADYIYVTNNSVDSGMPSEDGFKVRWKNTGIGLGANNDALIFEKTDANDLDPDGAFQFVMTGSDGIQEVVMNLYGDGTIDFAQQNIIYVPRGTGTSDEDIINGAISAAVAGDILVLAAGPNTSGVGTPTYVIDGDIEITKAINVVGQGVGNTNISSSTTTINLIHATSDNVRLSDFSISSTGGTDSNNETAGIKVDATGTTVFSNVIIENVNVTMSGAGYQVAIIYDDAGGIVSNCITNTTCSAAASSQRSWGVVIRNNVTAEAVTTLKVYYTDAYTNSTNSISATCRPFFSMDNSATQDSILYLYYCKALSEVTAGGGTQSHGISTNGGDAWLYAIHCFCNGETYDATNGGAVLYLFNCTLRNNTTSGLVTYLGTVATDKVALGSQGGGILDTANSQFVVHAEKGKIIEQIFNIIGSANIAGFWVFDETGAVTTIVDRSGNARNVTLGGNASTLSPAVSGLLPNLTMNGAAATSWSAGDNAAWTFGNGAGVDTAFSVVALVNPVDTTNMAVVAKYTSVTNNREWILFTSAADKLSFNLYKITSSTDLISKVYNTAITTDEGTWHVYAGTSAGGSPAAYAGLNVYRDGVQVGDTNSSGGVYAGMTDGTQPLASYYSTNYAKAKYGASIIINRELLSSEVKDISDLLLAYAGTDI